MRSAGADRGAVSLGIIAPIVAALIGGGAAIVAAVQIVNSAQTQADAESSSGRLSGSEIQYGDR